MWRGDDIWLHLHGGDGLAQTPHVSDPAAILKRGASNAAEEPAPASKTPLREATQQRAGDSGQIEQLTALLLQNRHEAAVDLYSTIYDRVSEAESTRYRDAIFAHAETLLAADKYESAMALLRQFVDMFYRDLDALALLARSQRALELHAGEIATLFAALDVAHLPRDITLLRSRLTEAIGRQAVALSNNPNAVLDLYRDLVSKRPEYQDLQLGLSRALLRLGRTDEAAVILRGLSATSENGDEINELLASIEQKRLPDTSVVPMRRVGRNFVVDALVNGRHTVTLLIDTGATLTVIRPQALQLAGVVTSAPKRITQFNTANGPVQGPIYRVRSLALGDSKIKDIEIGSMPLPGLGGIDGLLGMNFLNFFKFSMNQQQQQLLLNR